MCVGGKGGKGGIMDLVTKENATAIQGKNSAGRCFRIDQSIYMYSAQNLKSRFFLQALSVNFILIN